MLAGIAIGILAVGVYVGFFNSFHWYTDPPDDKNTSWFGGLFTVGRFLVPTGAIAGLAIWKLAGRYYR